MEPTEPNGESTTPATMIEQLIPFHAVNPETAIVFIENRVEIRHPWNDPSITLHVEEGDHVAIEALNSLVFPQLFSGVWHTDSKDMEFIYTPIPFDKELWGREFQFIFRDIDVRCGFGPASDRLLATARTCRFGANSETDYRNLYGYTAQLAFRANNSQRIPLDLLRNC